MGKTKRKFRRVSEKNMPKHKQNALMDDIITGRRSRAECMHYYNISYANYYRYVALAKERSGGRPVSNATKRYMELEKPVHGPFKPVVVESKTEAFPSGVIIRMSDMDMATGRYLTGMAMAFDKTIAQVIDDLVDVAVEIGTAHIHAKKEK